MKNTIGNAIELTIFGESHGPVIGAILDGLPAGFEIDLEKLNHDMDQRRAKGRISTARHESDQAHFVSGYFEGKTTGTPLTLIIENKAQRSADYAQLKGRLRPGHADLAAFARYGGHQDYRGGGHFSGRLTAAAAAAGAICRQILAAKGVQIGTHILSLHGIEDDPMPFNDPDTLLSQIALLDERDFPVLNEQSADLMRKEIEAAASEGDSVGGVLQTAVVGLPAGIGEPFFDSCESELAHLLFSIPAVKGVSFGEGFDFASLKGSQANDDLKMNGQTITTLSNHNGGLNGGITNGRPVMFQTVIKPTPSIYQPQPSVDYLKKEDVLLTITGRHDPAIIHRARAVVDAMSAFALLDLWMVREAEKAFENNQETSV